MFASSARDERPLKAVPPWIVALLVITFAAQVGFHHTRDALSASAESLPSPPSLQTLRAMSLGEEAVFARALTLWLQNFDNQPGISLPFIALDYERLIAWLDHILKLNPDAEYPLLLASRIYAEVPDPDRQQRMLDFVQQAFHEDPNARWQWMAHAVYIAKHRMKNEALALRYAQSLADDATDPSVPAWARQMVIFVLEDMGELDSAKVLLGGLLDSGEVTDPNERWFLSQRLAELEQQLEESARE